MTILSQAVVLLAAAVLVVPLLRYFGMASVLGYLVAGLLIGPWGLRLIEGSREILHATEFSVVLLMFVIGLELQPSRLWVLRHSVFIVGGAQVLAGSLVLGAVAWLCGLPPVAAAVVGVALSLSSTAFVLQMLMEKKQLTTRHGREGFAVLLFQDLAVIPLLAVLPLLSAGGNGARPAAWISLLALLALVLGGRLLLRSVFRLVARTRSQELFTMAALLTVMGAALSMELAGLSMSLGAFVAGVLLADSEFRHEIEANIEPFKGVLLGLFFVAVGMAANVGLLLQRPVLIVGLAAGLMLLKMVMLYCIARLARLGDRAGRRFAVYLCQGGEFAFVLFGLAAGQRLLDQQTADLLALTVTLSMALTPFLVLAHECLLAPRLEHDQIKEFDVPEDHGHPVIVAGFGRFGQIVSRMLQVRGITFTVLEANAEQVDFVRRFGNKVFYGDASRLELLRAAGADRARLFVLAIDDIEDSLKTVHVVRRHFPHLKIYARARNRFHFYRLMDAGVTQATRETFAASVELGIDVLQGLGLSPTEARQTATVFVEHDQRLLMKQQSVHHDEAQLIETSREAMRELEGLFEAAPKVADAGTANA